MSDDKGNPTSVSETSVVVSETSDGKKHVVLSRNMRYGSPIGRTYELNGGSENERIADAVKQVISDRNLETFQKR